MVDEWFHDAENCTDATLESTTNLSVKFSLPLIIFAFDS
jgi:hypothetical protein